MKTEVCQGDFTDCRLQILNGGSGGASGTEPGWMGCKQGVRGALLEAAGLSLPAVPCRA